MTTNELRAKFEMWCANHARNLSLRKSSGRVYWYADTLQAWELWLAANASRDAEVEALRKDAERYRAFRRAAIREDDSFIERVMLRIPDKDCTESQFDEAIDAAMR